VKDDEDYAEERRDEGEEKDATEILQLELRSIKFEGSSDDLSEQGIKRLIH